MRFCTNCHRMTAGKPLFCNWCGRSFDIRLCPRMHVNPRAAQVCAECGSRELSTPQPRVPLLLRPLVTLLQLGPTGLLLAMLGVSFAVYLSQLSRHPNGSLPLTFVVLFAAFLLYGWLRFRFRRKRIAKHK